MNRFLLVFFILAVSSLKAYAVENSLFGYTHLLPSPFTIPSGRIVIGTTTGVGLTDFLDVETDVISDIFQIYNGRVRLSILDFPKFAVGVYLGYQNVNLNNLSASNPSTTLSAWMPGGVVGVEVVPYVAAFVGVQLFYPNMNISGNGINTSGYLQGADIESDLSWAYNPHRGRTGNVLSGGVTYNTTFSFYGVGVSHHWPGFHLGIHYYPNAQNLKVLPIFAGGAVVNF